MCVIEGDKKCYIDNIIFNLLPNDKFYLRWTSKLHTMGVGSGGNGGNISPLRNWRGEIVCNFPPYNLAKNFLILQDLTSLMKFSSIRQQNHLVYKHYLSSSDGISILICLLNIH